MAGTTSISMDALIINHIKAWGRPCSAGCCAPDTPGTINRRWNTLAQRDLKDLFRNPLALQVPKDPLARRNSRRIKWKCVPPHRNSDNNYGNWNKKGQATEIELSLCSSAMYAAKAKPYWNPFWYRNTRAIGQ
jgi:hypothetical protein